MDSSLIDNIAFGDANPNEKKINECIDLSNLRVSLMNCLKIYCR